MGKRDTDIIDNEIIKRETYVTSNKVFQAIAYCAIMILGGSGFIFYRFGFVDLDSVNIKIALSDSAVYIVQALVLSFILEIFRFFLRKRKSRRTGIISKNDPFWFQVIEGAFALWIILIIILVLLIIADKY